MRGREVPGLIALDVTLSIFTQTGATLLVAEAMDDALTGAGHRVRLRPTAFFAPDEVEVGPGTLLGVGSATIYSRLPSSMRRYLDALPDLTGVRAFVFATASGASGRVLGDLGHALRERGAEVVGGQVFRGESGHADPSLRGRASGQPDERELRRAQAFALAAAEHVANERPGVMRERGPDGLILSRRDALRPGLGFYDLVGLAFTDRVVRRLLPPPELEEDLCIRCGWCAENCPSGCISFPSRKERRIASETNGHLREFPVVGEGCLRCYRCCACPQGAYQADWDAADRILRLVYHPWLVRHLGDRIAEWGKETP